MLESRMLSTTPQGLLPYVCVCMYIYIYIYIYTHTHTHTHTTPLETHIYIKICIDANTYRYIMREGETGKETEREKRECDRFITEVLCYFCSCKMKKNIFRDLVVPCREDLIWIYIGKK